MADKDEPTMARPRNGRIKGNTLVDGPSISS